MTLRRYQPLKASRGALGMKSPSTVSNLVRLCNSHHRVKTGNGRKYRPILLAYLAGIEAAK